MYWTQIHFIFMFLIKFTFEKTTTSCFFSKVITANILVQHFWNKNRCSQLWNEYFCLIFSGTQVLTFTTLLTSVASADRTHRTFTMMSRTLPISLRLRSAFSLSMSLDISFCRRAAKIDNHNHKHQQNDKDILGLKTPSKSINQKSSISIILQKSLKDHNQLLEITILW